MLGAAPTTVTDSSASASTWTVGSRLDRVDQDRLRDLSAGQHDDHLERRRRRAAPSVNRAVGVGLDRSRDARQSRRWRRRRRSPDLRVDDAPVEGGGWRLARDGRGVRTSTREGRRQDGRAE